MSINLPNLKCTSQNLQLSPKSESKHAIDTSQYNTMSRQASNDRYDNTIHTINFPSANHQKVPPK